MRIKLVALSSSLFPAWRFVVGRHPGVVICDAARENVQRREKTTGRIRSQGFSLGNWKSPGNDREFRERLFAPVFFSLHPN